MNENNETHTMTFDSLTGAFQREIETDVRGLSAPEGYFHTLRLIAMALGMCAMAIRERERDE